MKSDGEAAEAELEATQAQQLKTRESIHKIMAFLSQARPRLRHCCVGGDASYGRKRLQVAAEADA